MNYKQEVTKAMDMLAQHPETYFIGQTVVYPGSVISDTLKNVPIEKRLELPVAEEMQMGMSLGLALEGFIPITIYPRIDFLLCAINQLSNHLDVLYELTHNEYQAKVIIRTIIGQTEPMYPGIQHCRDHTKVFKELLNNINVVKLEKTEQIMDAYELALQVDYPTLIIEEARRY